eukprot:1592543-Amphidinium_carterae.1
MAPIFTPSSNAIKDGTLQEVISLLKMRGNNDIGSSSTCKGDCHRSSLNESVLLGLFLTQFTPQCNANPPVAAFADQDQNQ